MKIKSLFCSFLMLTSAFTAGADQAKSPIPPLRGPNDKPEYASPASILEKIEKAAQKDPLLGYVRVKNFENLQQNLSERLTSEFHRMVKDRFPLPITEPSSIFVWKNAFAMVPHMAAVLPFDLDNKTFSNWIAKLRKDGLPRTQAMQFSKHSPLSLLTIDNETRDRVHESGDLVESIARSPMQSDLEFYVNLKALPQSKKDLFVIPPILSMFFAQTANPLRSASHSSGENELEQALVQIELLPKHVQISALAKQKEPEIKYTKATDLPSVVHFLPEGALRFEWKTEDPEGPLFQAFPYLSRIEEPVLLRPILHILSEVHKHSKKVVVAGSFEAQITSRQFGPNRLLIIGLDNEKAADAFLKSLQQEAKWTNDGRLHATREDKYGMDLHISIRPACRKIKSFDVDCYYARITGKMDKKKRRILARPYTYQAVRVGANVLVSWNEEKPETTNRLNELVETFVSGEVKHPLQAIDEFPKGADLYMDMDFSRFLSVGSQDNSKVMVATYLQGNMVRQEIQIPRSLLIAAHLLKE